jgi:molecular chaperone DnaK
MGKNIGIDFGIAKTVVAHAGVSGVAVLDSREGKPYIRSVVGCKKQRSGGQEILVGDVAEDNWPMAPTDTIYSVKRLMGRGIKDPEVVKIKQWAMYEIVQPTNGTEDSLSVVMGGKQYSPAEISALILKKAKQDAELRLGEEVTHAVITVPAYFSQRQRDETREAGWKAGLKVSRILDEPTAAAIAFGCEQVGQDGGEPRYILVYDLGGGTFDISVLVTGSNAYSQLDLEGDMWLGGDNFDQLVVDYALERIKADYESDPRGNARFMVDLRIEARKAKERLTSARSAQLLIAGRLRDADGDPVDVDVEITRDDFENRARPLVDRTIELTERALKNAGLTREQVHDVLLAGNATNMPIVQQALDKMFGRDKVRRNMHPKHCVAMGAAILATRLGGIVCQSPDPGNPERECGEVNEDNATVCRKCGRPLVSQDVPSGELFVILPPDLPGGTPVYIWSGEAEKAGEPVVGGVAPFCYGVQTADDRFNVFIKKNDPYPTVDSQANTFYTQRPGQRMLCISVYGGDYLEEASLNEKQGEVFAILPRDLPTGTPVHIWLWLNSAGIFELQAFLDEGFDLRPWVLKGGADQKAVRALERLELEFAARAVAAVPPDRERIETEQERAFEQLRNGQAEEAEKTVEDAIQLLNSLVLCNPAGTAEQTTGQVYDR